MVVCLPLVFRGPTFFKVVDAGGDERKSRAPNPGRMGTKVYFLLEVLVAAEPISRTLPVDSWLTTSKVMARVGGSSSQ